MCLILLDNEEKEINYTNRSRFEISQKKNSLEFTYSLGIDKLCKEVGRKKANSGVENIEVHPTVQELTNCAMKCVEKKSEEDEWLQQGIELRTAAREAACSSLGHCPMLMHTECIFQMYSLCRSSEMFNETSSPRTILPYVAPLSRTNAPSGGTGLMAVFCASSISFSPSF